ncbi:hypothetical protein CWE21_10670 [Pseudidiomarina aquimaris]|uniref:Uncharacterized protein n=1 Tax=Pseudidiomarina aquimaris TaxID=641841 RepID=A0A432XCZ4_9GAMM|nr:hypothetical protein [Pseudidiomarina aquimaris]RUO46611.1 hypothetical protein CWE21_10670 [Pseudidiomarina aquimaris]
MRKQKLSFSDSKRLVEHAMNHVLQRELAEILGVAASRLSEAKKGQYALKPEHREKVEQLFGPLQTVKGQWLVGELLSAKESLEQRVAGTVEAFHTLQRVVEFNQRLGSSLGKVISFVDTSDLEDDDELSISFLESLPAEKAIEKFNELIYSPVVRAFFQAYGEQLTDERAFTKGHKKLSEEIASLPGARDQGRHTFKEYLLANYGLILGASSDSKIIEKCRLIHEGVTLTEAYQATLEQLAMPLPGKLVFTKPHGRYYFGSSMEREYIVAAQHILKANIARELVKGQCEINLDIYLGEDATHYIIIEVAAKSGLNKKLIKGNVPYRELISQLDAIADELAISRSVLVDNKFKERLAEHGGYIPTATVLE